MNSRDYFKRYNNHTDRIQLATLDTSDALDNDTEFNANQFKLYDDFTTDLRINFNPMRQNYHHDVTRDITRSDNMIYRRAADPNDSGVDMENGNHFDDVTPSKDSDMLENEVMVDPWSSMESSNSPLTDSGPSASEDCTPSTSSDPNRCTLDISSPGSSEACRSSNPKDTKLSHLQPPKLDKARSRELTLELETLEPNPLLRRPHFLDDDFQPPSRSNIECRIPKPHFLDHSPSPDEFDERSDITNPNFLDDEVDGDDNSAQNKSGALPKRSQTKPTNYPASEDRPHRTNYRSALHYGLDSVARSCEQDKRASQLYRGTWPGERDVWTGRDSASVRSFSSSGSTEGTRPSSTLENKMECVCSLISLLSLSPENNADLSGPLLDMSRSVESCIAMRQAGCIPLLVQLIHSKVPRETRDRAAKALRNIIHKQTDDKAGRREARVWRLLEQVREYCYILEDVVEARKEGNEIIEDDTVKHPSQFVAALMKLSFDEEHRHVVCQLGGLQVLAALVSGDQTAHGSRTDDNTCLTMRKYAGMTLTNLTFGDGNNKSLLCSFKDFMLALVEQLESPNDDMRQVTAAVLRNLSWRADTNSKQVLREVGAVKGLTRAAMTCQKEATLKSVLSALWNLTAHCSMNKVALCSVDGALGFLVDMLSYNSPTKTLAIVENAGGIMRNVSSHIAVREDYRQILRERSCLSVLLQHLKSPSLTVVSNSCGTLWNLSARCPLDQQFLWDHGAVPMLRSLIHSKHKMIAMGSSAALKNLLNSKPGKTHIISLDTTARNMNLPALPTLGARKQKAIEQELDQNLAETCDNIEPATSPSTSNREEKNLFTATERQIAMNLERHRMSSSSPLMGNLASQISLSHSAHLASYLSCSNTLLKGALVTRSASGSDGNVNRSDSKDSVTSTHSDSVFDRASRTGKVPVPTPRNKDLMKNETGNEVFAMSSKQQPKENYHHPYPTQPPVPPPRSSTELRANYTESGFDVDQDSCDQPIDFSQKYSETKTIEANAVKVKPETEKKYPKKDSTTYGDYQETDLDQPTDYSLRYAEHQSETGSDVSEPPGLSVHEDTIKHFATEGTPYETPAIFSTATSMSDLRVIGKEMKTKSAPSVKENPESMSHSDEKDTCSIEDPPRHDNDIAATTPQAISVAEPTPEKRGMFDTKFSSGMISPEKPINYCDEGTPGYFSRVSSLSSLGEPTEENNLAKRNAMATINTDPSLTEPSTSGSVKNKEGSKAVTFATEPVAMGGESDISGQASARTCSPHQRFVEETPLMFSRSSSLGSLPECSQHDDQGSVLSEVSRLTSGCISPSEIPDSPCAASALSPPPAPRTRHSTAPSSPPQEGQCVGSVFEERVSRFVVEHTPAQFSAATSLSSLTIDDEPKQQKLKVLPRHIERKIPSDCNHNEEEEIAQDAYTRDQTQPSRPAAIISTSASKEPHTPGEVCMVYYTEDTPAILSKAGSNSNLSVLSIESVPPALPVASAPPPPLERDCHDTSDSSNLSDAADLLEECIQKGIAKAVKNKGPNTDTPNFYRNNVYRSLPPYLRTSTETVKMSHEFSRNLRDSRTPSSDRCTPPPPLPPKPCRASAPPRPPPLSDAPSVNHTNEGRKHECRLPVKSYRADRPQPLALNAVELARDDSLSSLSLDSFGSTDREIFEETVKAGLSSVNPRASTRRVRAHRSLERSDRIPAQRAQDRNSARARTRRIEQDLAETSAVGRSRALDRSSSLSSVSNESFGSTDKEVFERCVRQGMSRSQCRRAPPFPLAPPESAVVTPSRGALDRMVGEQYSRERALLEEVIARGAHGNQTKNVHAPSADRAAADERARPAHPVLPPTHDTTLPGPTGFDSLARSNECLAPAPPSANTTLESDRDELEHSNESCADVLDGSWSDGDSPPAEPRLQPEWTDIRRSCRLEDTWNDNTCPDDVTFPTISGSIHIEPLLRSGQAEHGTALPDLLEKSEQTQGSQCSRPDLTDMLDVEFRSPPSIQVDHGADEMMTNGIPQANFVSNIDDGEQKFDSILSCAIEKEAARLAAQLKFSQFTMENSVMSLNSIDLDNVKPPSNLGSLLSLSASAQWDETSQVSKKSQRCRKKSLPVALVVKRALGNSMNQGGSSEHLDSNPISFLDNVKPPSEMENIDMEGSMVSVSSLVSEVADLKEKLPVVFDFKQPIQDFPLYNAFNAIFHDLDKVNPPSLFDEMAESTLEYENNTAQKIGECVSNTLNVVTDIPSGSENCTPLPSDVSSMETTPKRLRDSKYLTPKEKRLIAKDRYQTYTISDSVTESDVVEIQEEFITWTKSVSDRSEDYFTSSAETKSNRRLSAKQRRVEDRARYQTQTVDIHDILAHEESNTKHAVDPHLESLKQRLAAKKTLKQRRIEDAERFRTRTLSEDIPPSPTFVTRDANFENVETTTGYDSLSSNELNHQLLPERAGDDDDVFSRDADSGHNEDDFELNSATMQTYTRSLRHYLSDVESPAAVDMCVVNNLKNLEMTASYRAKLQTEKNQIPSSSDFASFEGDSNSEDKVLYESDHEESARPKPKIIKPSLEREDTMSLHSNEFFEREQDLAKAVRGRKKAMYVSPYRRNTGAAKKPTPTKTAPKSAPLSKGPTNANKTTTNANIPTKSTSKPPSAITSPKKFLISKSPTKSVQQKPISTPTVTSKALPLERQGTFTKEESTVPAKDLPAPEKRTNVPRLTKAVTVNKAGSISPSRLPQPNRNVKLPPALPVTTQKSTNKTPKRSEPVMKNSPSNHSLQSNEGGKTITVVRRTSRQPGSNSSVNSIGAKSNVRAVDSSKAVRKTNDQARKQLPKSEKRVSIDNDMAEPPRLIRSSTFEGQPKLNQVSSAPKQKSAIGMRISQIPSLRPKSTPAKINQTSTKKLTNTKVFNRKQINGLLST